MIGYLRRNWKYGGWVQACMFLAGFGYLASALALWIAPTPDMPQDPTLVQVLHIQEQYVVHKLHRIW